MVALLPAPELQFLDADGHPYSGGTLATYVVGTTTPKPTWLDPNQSALNTNPIVLDSAGRCIVFADGAYRCILRDSVGNLIYDQISDTIVSAAMQPVVSAPTIADAKVLLGITGFATSADLASAISTEQTARIAADTAETNARTAADANLQTQIDAINATLAGLSGGGVPLIQGTQTLSDSDGHKRVTFPRAYSSAPTLVVSVTGSSYGAECIVVHSDTTGLDVWFAFPSSPSITPVGPISFNWLAVGLP